MTASVSHLHTLQPATDSPARRIIEVQHLTKDYGGAQGTKALDDVSFEVGDGEFVAIVGPSGCGKSTLLNIMIGLLEKTGGVLRMRDEEVNGPRKDIGVVFQRPVLFPWRTVLQNVMLPIDVLRTDRKAGGARSRELLSLVDLEGFENRYPWQLSGGMQQRVSIARGLVHDPAIILMDEPFGALDAMTREQMNVELQRIWLEKKKTIIFVTHSIPEAVFLADRVLVMTPRPGRLHHIENIDLPRPRDLRIMNTPAFGEHVEAIRKCFSAVGGLD